MSFDGLMMHHLTKEYHDALKHHRIDKIMYLNHDVFVFELYYQKERKLFYIEMHPNDNRLYYTPYKEIQSDRHPSLAMLKKTLLRSHIKAIQQYQSDRVCIITLESYDTFDGAITYELILEMMGKHANMILTKDQKIIEAYKKMVSEHHRSIAYHLPFQFFPSHKKPLTLCQLDDLDHHDLMTVYEGMSQDLASYIHEHHIKPLDIPLQPCIKGNKRYSYHVSGGTDFPCINDMMKENQTKVHSDDILVRLINKREQKLHKLLDDLSYHQSHLKDYLKAETLYAYCDPKAYVDRVDDIELDRQKSVHENAQAFLASYNKAKRAIPQIEKQLDDTTRELSLLKQLTFDLNSNNASYEDVVNILHEENFIHKKAQAKKMTPKNPIVIRIGDDLIYIGKNANMNAYVTHELSKPSDYFMHVKDAPGGHVICRAPKESYAFSQALQYAAYFSSLTKASKIEVMVAVKKDVKKIPGTHGSLVSVKTYTSYMVTLDDEFVKLCESL